MNREERRRAARRDQGARLAQAVGDAHRCPDCAATTSLVEAVPGVYSLTVAHDATCPAYQAMTKETS